MDSKTLRKKFLDFFEKNDHVIIPSASLVPSEEEQLAGKERVLFTSAGMQPLIPYLMGKPHPKGKRLADVQKCLRTDDIEQVGDATHHTFFEMLGNWSLGDYWKDEAIELSFKFLTEELKVPIEKLAISVFAGDKDTPKDEESANKWKSLGIPEKKIAYLGKEANWWPTNPSSFGPCGPDTEMFIWTGQGQVPEEFDPKNPKWIEVWNDVFMEFNRKEDGTLEELPQKNVDTGMGLERTLAVLNGKDNDYETDLFLPIIEEIRKSSNKYSKKSERIIADHLKAAVFLIAEGIDPDSKDKRGSVLRRLIKNIYDKISITGSSTTSTATSSDTNTTTTSSHPSNPYESWKIIQSAIKEIIQIYSEEESYKYLGEKESYIVNVTKNEIDSYQNLITTTTTTLPPEKQIPGKRAFDLYSTHGFSPEQLRAQGYEFNQDEYDEEFKKHQEVSRPTLKGVFKGGLAGHSETEIKYHTATHLLHQALRDVLGPAVFQKGSNITAERLRFDFSFDRKMTDEEIKKTEDLVNQRIKDDLKVDHMNIPLDQAKQMNAIGLFDEKYADKVSIYGVGPQFKLDPEAKDQRDRGGYYSLEFCGGPHVEHTGVIGQIEITKEEAVSFGIRRIYAKIAL